MKKFKLLSFLLLVVLLIGMLPAPALAVESPATSAQAVVLMDADTGEIMYQQNANAAFDPGALNMLLTALLVGDGLERQDIGMDDVLTQTADWRYNYVDGGRVAGYEDGDSFTVSNLLYMSVLISAEDAANGLAEYISGSGDAFADEMNSRAAELGCTGSYFVNAGGSYDERQHTTAHDIALIAQAVFQNNEVLPIFEATTHNVAPTVSYNKEWGIATDNALIQSGDSNYYEFAYAGKTSTTGIGANLVAAATYNEVNVIAVVVGCPSDSNVFAETRNLFDWVFTNFSYHTLLNSTDTLGSVPVEMGTPNEVSVRAESSIRIVLPNDEHLGDLTYELSYRHEQDGKTLEAPISAGQYMGEVTVYLDGEVRGTSRLVAATSSDISRLEYLGSQMNILLHTQAVQQTVKVLVIVLAVYLLLVAIYLFQRLRHLHSLRVARRDRAIARSQEEIQWLDLPDEPAQAPAAESLPPEVPAPAVEEPAPEAPAGEYVEPAPQEEYTEDVPPQEYAGEAPQEEYTEDAPEEEYAEETPQEEYAEEVPQEAYAEDVPEEEYTEEVPEEEYDEEAPEGEYEEEPEGEYDDGEYEEEPEGEYDDGEYEEEPEGEYDDGEYEEEPEGEYDDGEYEEEPEGEYDDGEYEDEPEGEYEDEEYYDDEEGPDEPPEKPKRRWWRRR